MLIADQNLAAAILRDRLSIDINAGAPADRFNAPSAPNRWRQAADTSHSGWFAALAVALVAITAYPLQSSCVFKFDRSDSGPAR